MTTDPVTLRAAIATCLSNATHFDATGQPDAAAFQRAQADAIRAKIPTGARAKYRVTFPAEYPAGSLGAGDVTARQGHYVTAVDAYSAAWAVAMRTDRHQRPLRVDVQEGAAGPVATLTLR